MFRFKSITSRIIFLHLVAVIVTAVVMPLVLYLFMNSAVKTLHHRAVREQAVWLARHLQYSPAGDLTLDLPEGLRDLFSKAYGRYTYAVLDNTGRVLFSSSHDPVPVFPADDSSSDSQLTDDSSPDVRFLETRRGDKIIEGAAIRTEINGKTIWVQLGEDLTHRDALLDDVTAQFLQKVGWTAIPILLLLLMADIIIVRHAVQPLLRASTQAQDISPTRIDVRLPIDDIPREILPLVIAVNQALDRLEQGFRRQREFTADAAHELRTPLAVLRARLETLPNHEVAEALHRDIEIMSRVVSQLLDSAEVETLLVDPGEKADLRDVCASVAEFVAPLALAQGKSITLRGAKGPVWVSGNAETLHRAIRNLAENALRHTPGGTVVELVVGQNGAVSVLDRGNGIPLAKHETIFERFGARDHHRTGGAGLGLSIVKRIIETHGGNIAVTNRPSGGAEFTIRLATIEKQAPASRR